MWESRPAVGDIVMKDQFLKGAITLHETFKHT